MVRLLELHIDIPTLQGNGAAVLLNPIAVR